VKMSTEDSLRNLQEIAKSNVNPATKAEMIMAQDRGVLGESGVTAEGRVIAYALLAIAHSIEHIDGTDISDSISSVAAEISNINISGLWKAGSL